MNNSPDNKAVFFEWTADARYFETKTTTYFRVIILLSLLVTVLLYFLHEFLLIFLVWILYFVIYVRATVPPPKIKYTLGKFGIGFYSSYLNWENMQFFGLLQRKKGLILRIFSKAPTVYEFNFVLPEDTTEQNRIINYLKDRIPFVEKVPESVIEKLMTLLYKLTGLE